MHETARAFIATQAAAHGPFSSVLEIGSRNVNGSIREYFAGADYLGVDLRAGDGVDVIGDTADLWTTDERFDAIVCAEVFEHEPRWPSIVNKIATWLAPQGVVFLTMASTGREPHSGIDGGPVHPGELYQNITPGELRLVLESRGFQCDLDTSTPGDLYAVAWID